MAAAQRDIRAFESEQEAARAALPPPHNLPALPSGLVEEPPGTPGLSPAPSSGLPLGVKLPPILTSSPAMDSAVQGILQGQQQLNQRLGPLQGDVEARRASLQGELDKPLPAAPKLNQIPQFQPRELDGKELALFGGIAMALAGLGTKAMRGDLTMALNAAGSAMKGFNDGNLQQSKLDMENFKRSMDAVIAENHRMSEEYRSIIESRKLSLGQKEQALKVAAASRDDQVMLSALSQGQLRTVFDLEAHRINATNQASLRAESIYQTAIHNQQMVQARQEALAARPEQLKAVLGPDGKVRYVPASEAVGAEVPPSGMNRPPPGEIMRMQIAISAANRALDNYEKLMKDFDPRSWDQLDPAQRAKIESAVSALQLEWKEAAALGALTGPDLEIMAKTLVSPSSFRGAYYGKDGLGNQINEARGYFGRRNESIREFYPDIGNRPGGAPAAGRGPAIGTVEQGYRFKGGDPSKRENWERVQ